MVKKTIRFDMYIKTSEQTPTYSYVAKQKVMSNDKDSTQITFNLLDVSPDELSGSSASILLYMQDGSFFQSGDVTIDRNSVIYTMKEEETKHSGNTKVQIVLKKGTVQTASLIYNFEIEKGLEKYPITEVMIQDWTTLTEEAKAFVEQIEGFTLEQFIENKMGQELANLEVNYATRLTGLEQKDNQLTAQLAQNATRISDNAISPDDFSGTDYDKLQTCFNYAISNHKSIRFARMYDITGHTIMLNKPYADRTVLYCVGLGGGIRKDDAGYIFSGLETDMGDITTQGMKFIGGRNPLTYVWDCNTLIRITSIGDFFNKLNMIEADVRFAQSLKFIGFTCVENYGWAISWKNSFDIILQGMIEHGQNGIRNTRFDNNPDNFNLKIDVCIEGMMGQAIELGSCGSVEISGYQERNGGYIDLSKGSDAHNGLVVKRCVLDMYDEQKNDHTKAIKWGKIGNNGALSMGNYCTGDLHEVDDLTAVSTGKLVHISDIAFGLMVSQKGEPTKLNAKFAIDLNKPPIPSISAKGLSESAWFKGWSTSNLQGWKKSADSLWSQGVNSNYLGNAIDYTAAISIYNIYYLQFPAEYFRGKTLQIKAIANRTGGAGGLGIGYDFYTQNPTNLTVVGEPFISSVFQEMSAQIKVPDDATYINIGLSGGGQSAYTGQIVAFDVWVIDLLPSGKPSVNPTFSN